MNNLAYYIVHGNNPGRSMEGHRTIELYCQQFEGRDEDFEVTIKTMNSLALCPYRIMSNGRFLRSRASKEYVAVGGIANGHRLTGAVAPNDVYPDGIVNTINGMYKPSDLGLEWSE